MKSTLRIIGVYIALALCLPIPNYGQLAQELNVIPPSPNAAALMKYGKIPVNLNTGIPNVSIPLYQLKEGTITVPISLSYHASGVRVQEVASWVGTNWSLNAGGAITRVIKGAPDELGNYDDDARKYDRNYFNLAPPLVVGSLVANLANSSDFDGEPDIFSFNVNGYSGTFVIDEDGIARFLPEEDFKVDINYNGLGNDFVNFIVTTPDGLRYHFGAEDELGLQEDDYIEFSSTDASPNVMPTSWLLRKIEDANQKYSIDFSYEKEEYRYRSITENSVVGSSGGCVTGHGLTNDSGENITLVQNRIKGRRLHSISSSNAIIYFEGTNTREDVLNTSTTTAAKRLDQINVFNTFTNTSEKTIQFTYDYMVSSADKNLPAGSRIKSDVDFIRSTEDDTDLKRLRLLSVQELRGVTEKPAYEFEYDGQELPGRLSFAIDHWGFYNGVSNRTLIPPFKAEDNDLFANQCSGADRKPRFPEMRAGILTKIIYPTGGYTEFEYGAHQAEQGELVCNESEVAMPNSSSTVGKFSSANYPQHIGGTACTPDAGYDYCLTNTFTLEDSGNPTRKFNNVEFYFKALENSPYEAIFELREASAPANSTPLLSAGFTSDGSTGGSPCTDANGVGCTLTQVLPATKFEIGKDYTVTIKVLNGYASFKVFKKEQVCTVLNPTIETVSSLRIEKLTDYPDASAQGIVNEYSYDEPVIVIPRYKFQWGNTDQPIGCQLYTVSPYSVIPQQTTQGKYVSYRNVKVGQPGNGYTRYLYNNAFTYLYDNFDNGQLYPPVPREEDYLRGKLYEESVYNEAGVIQSRTVYDYIQSKSLDNALNAIKSARVPYPTNTLCNPTNAPTEAYGYNFYKLYFGRALLNKQTTYTYDENGQNPVIKTMEYEYGTINHTQPTAIIENTTEELGETIVRRFKYAQDYSFEACENQTSDCYQAFKDASFACYNFNQQVIDDCEAEADDKCKVTLRFGSYNGDNPTEAALSFASLYNPIAAIIPTKARTEECKQRVLSKCYLDNVGEIRDCWEDAEEAYEQCRKDNITQALACFQAQYNVSDDQAKAIFELQTRNMVVPIEETISIVENGEEKLVSAKLTNYQIDANQVLAPHQTLLSENVSYPNWTIDSFAKVVNDGSNNNMSIAPTAGYVTRSDFEQYDARGNIQIFTKSDDVQTVYLWGYNRTLPVAQVVNASYDEVLTALGMSEDALQTLDGSSLQANLQKIRDGLPMALVTTYTYDPLVGMTSQTDPAGVTTKYSYDDLNRLKSVKDTRDNLLQYFNYQYRTNE